LPLEEIDRCASMRWLDVVESSFEGLSGNFFWLGQIGQVGGQKSHLGHPDRYPPGGSRPFGNQMDFGQVGGLGSQKSSGWCSIHKLSSVPSVNPDAYPLQR
jgi:hypothetical protein